MNDDQIQVLMERIAKVFLFNQLYKSYVHSVDYTERKKKIEAEMNTLRNELWP